MTTENTPDAPADAVSRVLTAEQYRELRDMLHEHGQCFDRFGQEHARIVDMWKLLNDLPPSPAAVGEARASDFLADPDKWLAHAKGGPVSVVDEKGRTVLVLSVPREEKATREAALDAALRELVEALPRCFFRGVVEGGHCTELAVYGVNSHTPEACEKHRYHEYRRNRECDWADAAREAAKLLREGDR